MVIICLVDLFGGFRRFLDSKPSNYSDALQSLKYERKTILLCYAVLYFHTELKYQKTQDVIEMHIPIGILLFLIYIRILFLSAQTRHYQIS